MTQHLTGKKISLNYDVGRQLLTIFINLNFLNFVHYYNGFMPYIILPFPLRIVIDYIYIYIDLSAGTDNHLSFYEIIG